jgi:hypothetical protein
MAAVSGNGCCASSFGAGCCGWQVIWLSLVCPSVLQFYSLSADSVVVRSNNVIPFAVLGIFTPFWW